MFKKYKIILSILQEFGGKINNQNFNILLFIYSKKFNDTKSFNFINVNKLPFSLTLLEDKKYLIAKNFLKKIDNWEILNTNKRFIFKLDMFEKLNIQTLKNELANKNQDELKNCLYNNYNNFFHTTNKNNLQTTLYTIGYEGLSLEEYINKLTKENINILCDVRKNAYSQKFGFSKNELKKSLELTKIKYIHIPNLGIKSENRQNLDNRLDYFVLFQEYKKTLSQKTDDINLLLRLLKNNKKIAITCFEKNHKMCHRNKITEFLKNKSDFEFNIFNL